MKVGISTASFFCRLENDKCFGELRRAGADVCEVFLNTYSEYNQNYGELIGKAKGDIEVHSVHVLNTNYEPQLYNRSEKVERDAFALLDGAMSAGEKMGAHYHSFHGVARLKKTPINMDFDFIGERTNKIIDCASKHGITLAYENVHWAYYNYPGFFGELKKRCPALKGTLDIKQAAQSGYAFEEYIKDMGEDIVTVHLSDFDPNGRIVLPGKGIVDFSELFKRLMGAGFDGAALIEVYKESYREYGELKESLDYLKEILWKIK